MNLLLMSINEALSFILIANPLIKTQGWPLLVSTDLENPVLENYYLNYGLQVANQIAFTSDHRHPTLI